MRSICKTIPIIGAFVLALSSAAVAADMPRMPSLPPMAEAPPLFVDEFSSGWYLRGDVGYRYNKVDDVATPGLTPSALNDTLPHTWVLGGGVGYKWEWFRTDLTVDYGTKINYTSGSSVQHNDFSVKLDNATGLLNVYGDLGTWWGFTPYIGAGVGVAWMQTADFRLRSAAVIDDGPNDQWNFAWGYMAGVSYRFAGNYIIDVGYRHVNLGDAPTRRDSESNRLIFKSLESDEIRVGFRYVLD